MVMNLSVMLQVTPRPARGRGRKRPARVKRSSEKKVEERGKEKEAGS